MRQVCGDVTVQPGACISHPQGDGGNSASLPGESTKDTVKTIRAGKAGRPASPVVQTVCIFPAHGSRVPAGARPSLRPFFEKGGKSKQSSGETRREEAKACLQVEMSVRDEQHCLMLRHCERSEAIQSLSAETVWIASSPAQNCFAILSRAPRNDDGIES